MKLVNQGLLAKSLAKLKGRPLTLSTWILAQCLAGTIVHPALITYLQVLCALLKLLKKRASQAILKQQRGHVIRKMTQRRLLNKRSRGTAIKPNYTNSDVELGNAQSVVGESDQMEQYKCQKYKPLETSYQARVIERTCTIIKREQKYVAQINCLALVCQSQGRWVPWHSK